MLLNATPHGRSTATAVKPRIGRPSVVLVDNARLWNGLVLRCRGSILQTYEWGELKAGFGWLPIRVALAADGKLIAGAQMLIRNTPLGRVAYTPRGPMPGLVRDAIPPLLAGLDDVARQQGAFCLKVEPEVPGSVVLTDALASAGFRRGSTIQPRSTMAVDLTSPPSEVWRRLSSRARYNVRLARRRGVEIAEGRADDLDVFHALLVETGRRAGFPVRDIAYYQAIWNHLAPAGMARLLLAKVAGDVLASAIVLRVGDSAYHMYAASSTNGRNLKPNDLLEWEAIRRSQAEGCISYDLWGIPDEAGRAAETGEECANPLPVTGLWGVYQFKRGFGGDVIRYAGAFDRVYSPSRYWLWTRLLPLVRRNADASIHGDAV